MRTAWKAASVVARVAREADAVARVAWDAAAREVWAEALAAAERADKVEIHHGTKKNSP